MGQNADDDELQGQAFAIILASDVLIEYAEGAREQIHIALDRLTVPTINGMLTRQRLSSVLVWVEHILEQLDRRQESLIRLGGIEDYERAMRTFEAYRALSPSCEQLGLRGVIILWQNHTEDSVSRTFLAEVLSWNAAEYTKFCDRLYSHSRIRDVFIDIQISRSWLNITKDGQLTKWLNEEIESPPSYERPPSFAPPAYTCNDANPMNLKVLPLSKVFL